VSRAALAILEALAGTERHYWDIVNWDGYNKRAGALAGFNAQRALDGLIRRGLVVLDDAGYCTAARRTETA